ncbi:Cytochrome c domain-containing protein OS=Castellaniella defragrans (strain DSM / CCUG 39792/ 65Phen) OX=1437824 GN=BN940_08206 PE=4 SV=1 [Castellaniella denitrificans]|uniref:urate hydroxylase PuuD n=1 Tax=Castellaniella sp. TaxID=1955812 RepID=UPI002AFE87CC|nr:urate hydroxylase PuuD [Castellaniella sp.]
MESFFLEYGNLLLRWLHVIAAIAWIGESIYFVMLDLSLHAPRGEHARKLGVYGEMWAVHGGGFYHNQKYLTNPAELPDDLHWSFWKSYTTWLSGFGLFMLLYLLRADIYLVNPASPWEWARNMNGTEAGILAVAFLVIGYNVYSRLCRIISPTVERDGLLSVAVGVMMVAVAWLTTQIFPGRAAFLITGALMATCMSASVLFWIIPGQRRMVKALKAGEKPNPLDGLLGKQRSVHNTYFTLPVIFLMLSNHYSFTYTNEYAWVIMSLFIFAGAVIRQYFVLRHTGKNDLRYPLAGIAMLAIIGWIAAPSPAPAAASAPAAQTGQAGGAVAPSQAAVTVEQVHGIVMARCTECHSAKPTQAGFAAAPAGIMLDTNEQTLQHADQIKQVVASKYMPLANLTQMTDEERAVIAAWNGK